MVLLEVNLCQDKIFNLSKIKPMDGTFKNNFDIPIHSWYPYIEGFSINFVKSILDNYDTNITVYDPFNGSGTTTLTASSLGIKSFASEINPIMRFIAYTKINTVKHILDSNKIVDLKKTYNKIKKELYVGSSNNKNIEIKNIINDCYLSKDFFEACTLNKIAFVKYVIKSIKDEDFKNIGLLALASIIVELSNMIRAADLRKKTSKEKMNSSNDVITLYINKLSKIISDIEIMQSVNFEEMTFISDNAKKLNKNYCNSIDLIITSPPYVNGTNYFRNTKLELWILDYIKKETDLKFLREQAITAGINNVSINNIVEYIDYVEPYAIQLDKISPDRRIPKMIRAYFSDMNIVFNNFYYLLKENGSIYFDIGDSEYYGVHIPVDDLIVQIARENGFILVNDKILRKRHSKTGKTLSQKLLIFNKMGQNAKFINKK